MSSSPSLASGAPSPSQSGGTIGGVVIGSIGPLPGALGVPGPATLAGPIVGDLPIGVYPREKFAARTRRRKRDAAGWPPTFGRYCNRLAGTLTLMTVRVAEPALTNTARLPSRLKMTLLRRLPARKFVPRTVSVSPTPSFIGATDEIEGKL